MAALVRRVVGAGATVAVIALVSCVASEPRADVEGLGEIEFANSGAAEAQQAFVRGALLLHSFEYEDAAEAFREAQAIDPDFALAYWGEAMTCAHPIWQEDEPDVARTVLKRLGADPAARLARAPTERERGLLEALDVLFEEGAARPERNRAYCAAMRELSRRFPDDLEIASFHALSILGTATDGRDVETYMRAAAVAEEVLAESPRHPGALHYAIHSYDDPVHAPLGIRMARVYGDVAPEAAHARHMPSHIWVALGRWDESARSNEAAWAAGEARVARKQLGIDDREWHSFWWLHYTYVQQERWREARELLDEMVRAVDATGSERTRSHLVRMRAEHLAGGDPRDAAALAIDVDHEGLAVASIAQDLYVEGLAAAAAHDVEGVQRAIDALADAMAERDREEIAAEGLGCCATPYDTPESPGRKAAQVMQVALEGARALAAGETAEALERLHAAAALDERRSADFGPPVVAKPVQELLGEVLLDAGRPDEARAAFEAALARAPGRAPSLRGLARAASDGAASAARAQSSAAAR
jgi:tetratricopeptide (TPR) repeat protein